MAKGKNSGMGVADTWAHKLIENESRYKKRGQTPLTDEQLVEEMEKEFPDKAGKSTLTRVSMIRGCYNKGTNLFANAGPSGSSTRPRSYAYDDDGTQLQPRQRKASAKNASNDGKKTGSKKKTSKKAGSKKKTAKKTGSKKKTSKKKTSKKKVSKAA